MDGKEDSSLNLIGFEWEYAEMHAAEAGLTITQVLTSPPRGSGQGTLRVVRQLERDGIIVCTCAAEDWGDSRW